MLHCPAGPNLTQCSAVAGCGSPGSQFWQLSRLKASPWGSRPSVPSTEVKPIHTSRLLWDGQAIRGPYQPHFSSGKTASETLPSKNHKPRLIVTFIQNHVYGTSSSWEPISDLAKDHGPPHLKGNSEGCSRGPSIYGCCMIVISTLEGPSRGKI